MVQDELLERLRDFFAERHSLAAVYLFGSTARGTQHAGSDVDIGVLYEESPPRTLAGQPFDQEADLADTIERPVQIVVMNDAPVDLVHRILRDGIMIVDANPGRRIAFEVDARNRYWDLKPILDENRKARR